MSDRGRAKGWVEQILSIFHFLIRNAIGLPLDLLVCHWKIFKVLAFCIHVVTHLADELVKIGDGLYSRFKINPAAIRAAKQPQLIEFTLELLQFLQKTL